MFCMKCGSKVPKNKEKCDVCGAVIKDEEIEILSEEKTIKMKPIKIEEVEELEELEELEEIEELEEFEEIEVEEEQVEKAAIEKQETKTQLLDKTIEVKQVEEQEDDAPVIIESHTFIDDNSLKNKIQEKISEENLIKQQIRNKRNKKLFLIGAFAVVLITLSILTPKLTSKKDSGVNMRIALSDTAIVINGEEYNIYDTYNKFNAHGWSAEFAEDKKEVDPKAKTSIVELTHDKYKNNGILVSLINQSDKTKTNEECGVWSIKIDNYKKDYPIEFTLPGNIKTGSTIEEIIKAYGKLEEENIYRSEQSGYTKYHYKDVNNSYLDLVVYDDIGLRAFTYMKY